MKEVVHVTTQEENDYVYNNIKYNTFNKWRGCERFIILNYVCAGCYYYSERTSIDSGYKIISFKEFKSRYEPKLKIGDTFEHNGFICEVLHQIDEKKWFLLKSPDNRTICYEKLDNEGLKDINHLYTKQEITDKEFIKQLEENAK